MNFCGIPYTLGGVELKHITWKSGLVIGFVAGILFASLGFWQWQRQNTPPDFAMDQQNREFNPGENISALESAPIVIHLAGAVQHPGLLKVASNTRLGEAIEQAGGATKEASLDALNLAIVLEDGNRYYIPNQTEVTIQEKQAEPDDGKVDLNRADAQELMTLPQIGETRAKAILEYREKNGPFHTTEDLKKVNGIGDGIYAMVRDFITVR